MFFHMVSSFFHMVSPFHFTWSVPSQHETQADPHTTGDRIQLRVERTFEPAQPLARHGAERCGRGTNSKNSSKNNSDMDESSHMYHMFT